MVRIINPKGQMVCVEQIQPVCEKQLVFNGRKMTIMEPAKNWSVEPTALVMQIRNRNELVVGNLKPETAREIVRALGEKEYFDFSTLVYQEAESIEKVVLDDGESAAYSSCMLKYGIMRNFCCGMWDMMLPMGGNGGWTDLSAPTVGTGLNETDWETMEEN